MTILHKIPLRFARLNALVCETTAYKAQRHVAKPCPSEDETQATRQHPPLRFANSPSASAVACQLSELTGLAIKIASGTATQTHQSRQPARVVGNMKPRLSPTYAIAVSLIRRIERPRVGARVFGQLALAGLFIFRKAEG